MFPKLPVYLYFITLHFCNKKTYNFTIFNTQTKRLKHKNKHQNKHKQKNQESACVLPYYKDNESPLNVTTNVKFSVSRWSGGGTTYNRDIIVYYRLHLVNQGMANYYVIGDLTNPNAFNFINFTSFEIPNDTYWDNILVKEQQNATGP